HTNHRASSISGKRGTSRLRAILRLIYLIRLRSQFPAGGLQKDCQLDAKDPKRLRDFRAWSSFRCFSRWHAPASGTGPDSSSWCLAFCTRSIWSSITDGVFSDRSRIRTVCPAVLFVCKAPDTWLLRWPPFLWRRHSFVPKAHRTRSSCCKE